MDLILLLSLALLPISAWIVWFWLWKRSGTDLIVLTCVTGFVLYLISTYAIWADAEAWIKAPLQTEIGVADVELKNAGERELSSFTQLTLPALISLWFAVVFCVGAISEYVLVRTGFKSAGLTNITSRKDQDPEQSVACTTCGRSFKVHSALVGLTGTCPHCNATITLLDSENAV